MKQLLRDADTLPYTIFFLLKWIEDARSLGTDGKPLKLLRRKCPYYRFANSGDKDQS